MAPCFCRQAQQHAQAALMRLARFELYFGTAVLFLRLRYCPVSGPALLCCICAAVLQVECQAEFACSCAGLRLLTDKISTAAAC